MKPILFIHINKIPIENLFDLFKKLNYQITSVDEILRTTFKVDHDVFKKHSKYWDYVETTIKKIDCKTIIDIKNDCQNLEKIIQLFIDQSWIVIYLKIPIDYLYSKIVNNVLSNELNNKLMLFNHVVKIYKIQTFIYDIYKINQIYFEILDLIN
jgi:hypothetical protein